MKRITFIPGRTGRETREDDTSNKSDDRKREKGNIEEREVGPGGRDRKKEGLSVVRDVLVLRHMESRSASWPLQCVELSSSRYLESERVRFI